MVNSIGRIKIFFMVIGFLLFGLVCFFYPTLSTGFHKIQTDPGDTRFNNYVLEHGYQWVAGNPVHKDFWSPPIFFPTKNTLAYSDILLGAAPFYWFWRMLGIEPDTSFQFWTMVLVTLNFLFMLLILKTGAGFSSFASTIGAYIFAFANIRVVQVGHPQLLPQFYSLLAVFALIKMLSVSRKKAPYSQDTITSWIYVFFLTVVLQFYASLYLGWFLAFGMTVCLLASLFFQSSRRQVLTLLYDNWKMISIAAAVSGVLLSWMGLHYFEALKQVSGRTWDEMDWLVPRVQSWFFMGYSNILYGWTSNWILSHFRLTQIQEHQLGLGLVTLACSLLGFREMWRTVWGKVIIVSTLFIFVVSLNFLGYLSLWRIVQKIYPGGTSIRAVCRVSLLLLIVFSFGVATFLNQIKSKWLAYALAGVMCLEQVVVTPSYDKKEYRDKVDKIVQQIPASCEVFYYANFIPKNSSEPPWVCQLDAMWAQIRTNKPTLNGYSGNEPPGWTLSECLVKGPSAINLLERNLHQWLEKNHISQTDVNLVINGE